MIRVRIPSSPVAGENHPPRQALQVGLLVLWLAAVGVGLTALIDYSSHPGRAGKSPSRWPHDSSLTRNTNRPTLVLFLHPHCSCSRATLNQLARVLSGLKQPIDAQAVFFRPEDQTDAWAHTDLWRKAKQLTTKPPRIDRAGREAMRFGVTTSGHVFLYAATGERLYSGGITNGRGHEGDNVASQAMSDLLDQDPVECSEYPVYGCPIVVNQFAALSGTES